MLVDTNAKCGDQKKNPFHFPRKFNIKKDQNDHTSVEIDQTCMYEKLKDMHKANRDLQQQLESALSQILQTIQQIAQPPAPPQPVATEPLQSICTGRTTRAKTNGILI